jgi:hypothetical protein
MARPRRWEHGDAKVPACTPLRADFDALQAGRLAMPEYFARCRRHMRRAMLRPGELHGWTSMGKILVVLDGDTLCCACARDAPCHRQVVAGELLEAGWRVVLDGVPYG